VPELVFGVVVGTFRFPSEPDFIKESLSIKPKFVVLPTGPLRMNPLPKMKTLVLLVTLWHSTMAINSFKLDHLFVLLVPELVVVVVVGNCPNEPDVI
jgi:hypothetical protein